MSAPTPEDKARVLAATLTREEVLDLNAAVRHYRDNGLDRGSPASRRLEALHKILLTALV